MTFVALLQWAVCAPPALLFAWFAIEVLAGLRPLAASPATERVSCRVVILIPAHNEAGMIGSTVQAALAGSPGARLLVVADNCGDDTATQARSAGAEVIERSDPSALGKGHALAFGRDYLVANPPDAVVVLDADCRISSGGAELLAQRACERNAPAQAANLTVGGSDPSPEVAISNFAMMVKNVFRARGMMRIGGGALLYGTGMAFPWSLFASLPLATSDATEDISIGLDLASRGRFAVLVDDVRVTSPPAAMAHSRGQRSRWEHGFLRNMVHRAVPLLLEGVAKRSRRLSVVAAHMIVPPLALLAGIGLVALFFGMVLKAFGGSWVPPLALLACLGLALAAIIAAWNAGGREVAPFSALLRIPQYVLWKLPIYTALFGRRQVGWNRTERDPDH